MTDAVSTARIVPNERIHMLDVLRGIAILAILYMNIPDMAGLGDDADPRILGWTTADQVAFGATWFMSGTMRGLLQLLFGAGMMISMRASLRPDGPVGPADAFMRRNMWLVLFGAAHIFILLWPGDILLIYGLAALFLLPFRLLGPRTLLGIGIAINLLLAGGGVSAFYLDRMHLRDAAAEARAHEAAGETLTDAQKESIRKWDEKVEERTMPPAGAKARKIEEARQAHQASFGAYYAYLFKVWKGWVAQGMLAFGPVEAFAAMLIGAALHRWGVIQGRRSTRFYAVLLALCYGGGAIVRALSLREYLRFSADPSPLFGADFLIRLPISVGHVALIALLMRSALGARLLRPFEANGRLPLSTYMGASIICMWIIFAPFGLGLWGRFGAAGQWAIVSAVLLFQLAAANLWLLAFETGPPEWAWKSLAYWRRQPFLRRRLVLPGPALAPAE